MRAELPWNVAGIPPEAREAARAAARREGLSVGEWLTRRILRSFSDMGDDPMPMDRPPSFERGGLDAWGLPQSTAARRDSEEMLARVSRSETESTDSWRRIEEQLRGVARRLDSSERSQSENNRVLSKTAAEMNIAAREQAQVFDQVGQTVMAINERLDRLERDRAADGTRDAVKALHQGLSRLADQIAQTANQSAAQVNTVTQSLDQLAHRLGQIRIDAEAADKALEQRVGQVEKSGQLTTNALDHMLERIETQANQRAGDQVEWQRRAGGTEESLVRLEDSVSRLERASNDPALDRRLAGLESGLAGVVSRLENYNPAAQFEETVHALARRLDSLEKSHSDLMDEMRANIVGGKTSIADPAGPQSPPFEAPPFAEASNAFAPEPPTYPGAFLPPYGTDAFSPDAFAAGNFTMPGAEEPPDPFAPLGNMVDPAPAETGPENFLSAARRSARAAAEKTVVEKKSLFAGFRLGRAAAAEEAEEKKKSTLLVPILVLAIVAVAGVFISQRLHRPAPIVTAPAKPAAIVAPPAAAPPSFTPAPLTATPGTPAPRLALPRSVKVTPIHPIPAAPKEAAPTAAPPKAAPPQQQGAGLDRVTQLANSGNAVAETIIGLRALDGGNGSAANPADALKWLTKAAEQGQAVAQYRLGTMYERGQAVAANPATAAHWYELAATQGNRKAMHNLAVAFAEGATGKKNMPEAARWFSKAAALGLSDSQFNLAVLYERGDGVPQSLLDAFKWYAIAAAAGDSESKQRLAVLQTQLAEADRNAAQKSASSFHAAPLIRSTNVPPEPADLPNN